MSTCVLIVDSQPIVGAGLDRLLAEQTEFVTAACTLTDALPCIELHQPRIVIINLHQHNLSEELQLCRALADVPGERTLLLLAPHTPTWNTVLVDAFEAGADGVLDRDELQVEALVAALTELTAGRSLWNMRELRQALGSRRADTAKISEIARAVAEFTAREREVFDLLAAGLPNADIAERLSLSERTVQGHVSNVLQKLGVNSRAEAVAAYCKWQLAQVSAVADDAVAEA